jgi:hypothetical protein
MKKFLLLTLAMLFAAALAGCQGDKFGWPSWMHPGSAQQQGMRAARFDPYPQTDPGSTMGPNMGGTRPRDYDTPIPEVDRARWPKPCP